MCSRSCWLGLLLVVIVPLRVAPASGQVVGGHGLELAVVVGHIDFADEIRFDDDAAVGLRFMADLRPWWQLGMQFDHTGARDRLSGQWQDILVASVQTRIETRPDATWSPTGGVGVSFMAFENDPQLDAVAEGLDLSLGVRWSFDPRWRVRAEVLGRVQTFTVTEVNSSGIPTGAPEETGYRWSTVLQLGLGRGF